MRKNTFWPGINYRPKEMTKQTNANSEMLCLGAVTGRFIIQVALCVLVSIVFRLSILKWRMAPAPNSSMHWWYRQQWRRRRQQQQRWRLSAILFTHHSKINCLSCLSVHSNKYICHWKFISVDRQWIPSPLSQNYTLSTPHTHSLTEQSRAPCVCVWCARCEKSKQKQ